MIRSVVRAWFACLAVGLVSTASARAADEAQPSAKAPYVVIVGVADTADKTILPRPSAEVDAKALFDLLSDPKYFNVPADRIHNATTKTGKDDLIILAYFSRGASSGDRTCLFTAETTFKDRAKNSILGSDLEADLKAAKNQRLMVVMDVHFKGFDAGKEAIIEPTLSDVLKGVYGGEDKAESNTLQDRLLMLSTIPSADPVNKGESSLFSATMIEALKGKADTEGYEPDGLVTVDELTKYLEKVVADEARTLGKTAKEKEAIPFIVGEEVSHFVITKNPAITESVAKRLKTLDELTNTNKIGKEMAIEGKQLLSRMPKLKSLQEIRKQLQSLTDGKTTPTAFTDEVNKIKKSMILSEEEGESYMKKVMTGQRTVDALFVKQTVPGELVAAAIRGLFRRLEEPIPADIEEMLKGSKEWKKSKMEEALIAARTKLGRREDLENNKDADLSITMMLASLNDPYTVYFDKETVKKVESQFRGRFSGVGIQIRRDLVNDALLVASPIKNSPAYKAGIQTGDLIVGIKRDSDPEGKPLTSEMPTEFSTKGMKTEKALDIILGKPGIPITLSIKRGDEIKDYTIERGFVSVETVMGVVRDEKDNWKYWLDEKEKIAYIHLTQFTNDSIDELNKALRSLTKAGVKGLVMDVRFNPGGSLEAAGGICSMFVKDGKVVSVRPRLQKEEIYKTNMFRDLIGTERFLDVPMAVLINGNSASASEILAACLQDYGRAKIIGDRSYGKGSVQTVRPFRDTGGQFKMTIARYFPPSDRNIDKSNSGGKPDDEWGVKPDTGYDVTLSREEQRELADVFRDREIIPRKDGKGEKTEKKDFTDKQLNKALEYIKEQVKDKK
jgi:carboxyl-terminal processing protease